MRRLIVLVMSISLSPVAFAPAAQARCEGGAGLCGRALEVLPALVGLAAEEPEASTPTAEPGLESRIPYAYALLVAAQGISIDHNSRTAAPHFEAALLAARPEAPGLPACAAAAPEPAPPKGRPLLLGDACPQGP